MERIGNFVNFSRSSNKGKRVCFITTDVIFNLPYNFRKLKVFEM
jgi:hypothetical protein